jgi:hypothetical protein
MERMEYQKSPDVKLEANTEFCLPFRWHSRVNYYKTLMVESYKSVSFVITTRGNQKCVLKPKTQYLIPRDNVQTERTRHLIATSKGGQGVCPDKKKLLTH